jgi:hypothetical protein
MDTPERGALMLVRFIAVSLISISVVEFTLYWVVSQHNQTPMQIFPCVLKSIPFLLGMAALIKARALAQWVSDKLE